MLLGVAVVSGVHGGIGKAVADRLHLSGVDVVGVDVLPCPGKGSECVGRCVQLDVTDRAGVEDLVRTVEADHGPVTQLANVAGILRGGHALDLSVEDWERTIGSNLFGVVNLSTAVGRRMKSHGHGVIVTVGSNAARVARVGMSAYGASKAAAKAFTLALGVELGRHGVRCVVVEPGSTDTPMLSGMCAPGEAARQSVAGVPDDFKAGIPLGRVAAPEDIADVVAYLLSPRARHVTVTSVVVDGGASLGI